MRAFLFLSVLAPGIPSTSGGILFLILCRLSLPAQTNFDIRQRANCCVDIYCPAAPRHLGDACLLARPGGRFLRSIYILHAAGLPRVHQFSPLLQHAAFSRVPSGLPAWRPSIPYLVPSALWVGNGVSLRSVIRRYRDGGRSAPTAFSHSHAHVLLAPRPAAASRPVCA